MKQPFTEEWNRWLPEAKRVERGLLSEQQPKIDSVIDRVRGIAEDFYWAGFKAGELAGFKAGEWHAEEARLRDRMVEHMEDNDL